MTEQQTHRGVERINYAFVLAAGLGTRMHPLTLKIPKPLVEVGGRCLIDRALDGLEKTAVGKVVVNLHHLGGQIKTHLEDSQASRPFSFAFSDENGELLDSGGGVVKALPLLGDKPFFILNSDTFWQEERGISNLARLEEVFDRDVMDMLLLVVRRDQLTFPERGDFMMDEEARLIRAREGQKQAVIYGGALIVDPALFIHACAYPHSLNIYFDLAIKRGRLFGLMLEGQRWFTVGTMAAVERVNAML